MRTNIEIDDQLMSQAIALSGLPTKKSVVEEALRQLVRGHERRRAVAAIAGLGWDGDLDASREGGPHQAR